MIDPKVITYKAQRQYNAFLRSELQHNKLFPMEIPGNMNPSTDPAIFQSQIGQIVALSKEKRGYGYNLELKEQKTKRYGLQTLPERVYFATKKDYLQYLEREKEVQNFLADAELLRSHFPELEAWMLRFPQKIITYHELWPDLIKVFQYFKKHPKPNLYIRELPIEVHPKFIENNKSIIKDILNILMAAHLQKEATSFNARFNLKEKEMRIRFRLLDDSLKEEFNGLDDLSIPVSDFCRLQMLVQRVLIVENECAFLSMPPINHALVIFGNGFEVDKVKEAVWLQYASIIYWGNLDVEGFQTLSQLRNHFPQTQSLMMNRPTFDRFFENDKGSGSNVKVQLHLDKEEEALYQYLKKYDYGLEQEKIPHWYVVECLEGVVVV